MLISVWRWLALSIVWIALLVMAPLKKADADEFKRVQGTALPRESYEACESELKTVAQRLASQGIHVTKANLECLPVEGEPESFEPTFKGVAARAVNVQTVQAMPQESRSLCKQQLEALSKIALEDGESLLEQGCVPLTVQENEDSFQTLHQPMLIVLK